MCILLFVLKNERQQCQYKHTKNHKILEGVIYHRHHLHSNGISATPPCSGSCQSNRLRLLGHYHMARIYQSAASYGLASWMRPQHGCPYYRIM